MNDEETETVECERLSPRPFWGRGWTATRALTSGGGQGAPRSACRGAEGGKLVKTQYPYRRTRSLTRTAGQIDKARELRQTSMTRYLSSAYCCGLAELPSGDQF